MADDQAQDRPSAEPQTPVNNPHDKYFFDVFSDAGNAAGLLRPHLPQAVARTLRWSTLTHLPGRFVSDDWRGREADLLLDGAERRFGDRGRGSAAGAGGDDGHVWQGVAGVAGTDGAVDG